MNITDIILGIIIIGLIYCIISLYSRVEAINWKAVGTNYSIRSIHKLEPSDLTTDDEFVYRSERYKVLVHIHEGLVCVRLTYFENS